MKTIKKKLNYHNMRLLTRRSDWAAFQGKYDIQPNGCWIWNRAKIKSTGYGRMGMQDGTVDYAHRASWRIFRSTIPEGIYVCHHCDNPSCVNPEHLFLGTPTDNMQDASKKGRIKVPIESFASDDTHQVAKMTNEQVRFIRANPQISGRVLSKMFGVTPTAISCARRYKTFRDVK